MSTSQIVEAQKDIWFGFILVPSFVIYMIAMVGETNRAPFDLPEAGGGRAGGFPPECALLSVGFFFRGGYTNRAPGSALATTVFLGGWRAPWPISLWDGANEGWWPVLWFTIKVLLLLFVFVWLRGTLPRLRYDQFMRFGWKVLIPLSLLWILTLAGIRVVQGSDLTVQARLAVVGGPILVA